MTASSQAMTGETQAAADVLKAMLDSGFGLTICPTVYHPAFDGIRADPIYTEFMKQYAPEEQQ